MEKDIEGVLLLAEDAAVADALPRRRMVVEGKTTTYLCRQRKYGMGESCMYHRERRPTLPRTSSTRNTKQTRPDMCRFDIFYLVWSCGFQTLPRRQETIKQQIS